MKRFDPFALAAIGILACGEPAPAGTSRVADTGPENDGAIPKRCNRDGDCDPDRRCGFAIFDGCRAIGVCLCKPNRNCFPQPPPPCDAISPGCACDGTFVSVTCNAI